VDANRFDSLLEAYQSGAATAADVADLEKLLRGNASLRLIFVEHSLLEAQLRKVFSHEGFASNGTPAPAPPSLSRRAPRIGRWLAIAATVVAVLGIGLWLLVGGRATSGNEVLSGQIALRGAAVTRIPDGVPFDVIGSQSAVIRLADGSRVEMAATSKGTIQGQSSAARQVVELRQGRGKFQVAKGAGKFRVETPVGAVIALGTEFSVRLRPPPKPAARPQKAVWLDVAVISGNVQVDTKKKSYQLSGGQHRLYDDDGDQNNVDDGDQNNHDDGDRG
jgi:ferric-dicitrate binding protein FerR (iron transport regulator)